MSASLRAGIIAAGDGLRLKSAFPDLPKPLVPIGGRPLADWIVNALKDAGVGSIVMLLNPRNRPVREHLKSQFPGLHWTFLEKDTRTSWESFRLVSRALAGTSARFLVSTIDVLAPAVDVALFARTAANALQSGSDAALAVTRFVEDEKPLWAELGPGNRITSLGDAAAAAGFVTSGLYALTRSLADEMPAPKAHQRLRDYWRAVVTAGRQVLGVPISKTIDVDRPEDLATAQAFVPRLEGTPS